MDVGIRELRNQLSKWVARVRGGEEVTITDRGKAVARIVPVEGESNYDRLVREGVITPARARRRPRARPRVEASGSVSDLVVDDRSPR
jgi:prevent-host-death family protein